MIEESSMFGCGKVRGQSCSARGRSGAQSASVSHQPPWMNLLQMRFHSAEGGGKKAGLKVDKERKSILQQTCLGDRPVRGE